MDIEMAAGFAVVAVCLLVITILVFASRGVIENTHRKSSRALPDADHSSEESGNRGDAR